MTFEIHRVPGRAPPPLYLSLYLEMAAGRLLLALLVAVGCRARPEGPPPEACFDMTPRHGGLLAQSSPSPVTFLWNRTLAPNTVITPGQYIEGSHTSLSLVSHSVLCD